MDTPMEMDPRVCPRKQPHGKVVNIVASEVRRYIDHAGDWTILDHVPAHLVKMITLATPHPNETHHYEQYTSYYKHQKFLVEDNQDIGRLGKGWALCSPFG